MYKEVNICPISGDEKPIQYLDLGMMPLVNNLNNTREESLSCPKIPLKINYYPKSGLSMLSHIVDPNILFSHYVYKSGTSQPYIDHCKEMYDYISKFINVQSSNIFVDIGGNDGTLLKIFLEKNSSINAWNFDPSDVSVLCQQYGIKLAKKPWNSENIKRWNSENHQKKANVITSTNVFQHIEDINDFVKSICSSLDDDGIWCLEFPYWKSSLETFQYDQVYQEHIYYYLITPLIKLFDKHGLEIIDISEHKIHGGSLRIISQKKKLILTPFKILSFLEREKELDINYYLNWSEKVKHHIKKSNDFIYNLKFSGYNLAGFGAAAKGCVFLNITNIDYNVLDYIVDDTDIKQGKYVPGTGIHIVNREKLKIDPPDYLIILAHNFADYIMESVRPIFKGKFIVMFPEPKIYE